jgi:hypothetical protein
MDLPRGGTGKVTERLNRAGAKLRVIPFKQFDYVRNKSVKPDLACGDRCYTFQKRVIVMKRLCDECGTVAVPRFANEIHDETSIFR